MSRAGMLFPHFQNVRGQGDRISSAADPSLLDTPERPDPYFDRKYGHTWSFTPKPGAAVYGITDRFEASPIDRLANGRFLRVPFRRVPVIDIASPEVLAAFAGRIVSADKTIHLMWRGQTKEHYVERPEEERLRLFGSTTELEPSVIPSAARDNLEFTQVFPSWGAILDVYLSERGRGMPSASPDIASFRASYFYRLWSFATAQHYGLPSVGLDVTSDLWTAVMFALHEFTTDKATGATAFKRVDSRLNPVVYAMGGFENDLFPDDELSPPLLQGARPKAQHAWFFGTGWGAAANKAAERILIAFRLVGHATWKLPKSVPELFPTVDEDTLLAFLLTARERFPEIAKEAQLQRVYYLR